MKKIYIYNVNQFTKTGKMKKNAQTEMGLSFVDVVPRTEAEADKQRLEANEYIAKTIKSRGYHSFTSPYIFTHIHARNDKGELVIIRETVSINGTEISTTPQTLYKLLTK